MTQAIFEAMGGSYMEVNGFRIPCLLSLSEGQQTIGVWGQRHLRYIQEHRRATYISLKTTGKMNNYIAGIDQQAEEKNLPLTLLKLLLSIKTDAE